MSSQPNSVPLPFAAADLSGLVILEFWGPWCGPCLIMNPVLKQLEETGQVRVLKINMDEQPELGTALDIRAIPTLILVQDGVEVARKIGTMTFPNLGQWVQTYAAGDVS